MPWPHNGASSRPIVMGRNGLVASAHPQASLAGLEVLRGGGNAADAAVAVSAALDVVEPFMSGLGGGGALLVKEPGARPVSLHYGGRFPAAVASTQLSSADVDKGAKAFAVPGNPAGWHALHDAYGSKPLAELLAPAIALAEDGFALTRVASSFFKGCVGRMGPDARQIFAPGGEAPGPGALLRQPMLANTYRMLAQEGLPSFYEGEIAREIVRSVSAAGGLLSADDLDPAQAEWAQPSASVYRGLDVFSTGWPFTSYETLLALNVLEATGATNFLDSADGWHARIESAKVAMTDRVALGGERADLAPGLLSSGYARERAAVIASDKALRASGDRWQAAPPRGTLAPGDPSAWLRECTTHFDIIDADGMAVSVTQTLGSAFGSGFVAGNTGVLLNNLMFFFDLDDASPMTIKLGAMRSGPLSPVMVADDNRLLLSIGTPGAFGIPQTTMQMVSNVIDGQMNVQAAIEAPRFRLNGGLNVAAEARLKDEFAADLKRRGHDLKSLGAWSVLVGGGQGLLVDPDNGVYSGGADPRRDGYAMAW